MKSLFAFLLGIVVGAAGFHFLATSDLPGDERAESDGPGLADRAREEASDARESIGSKFDEWDLDPDEIRRELSETGQVVRSKAIAAGERIDDARIVAIIKAKLVLDRELSALAINVDCADGKVTLTGTVDSPEKVARVMALALDTEGVVHATAQLTVEPK